MPNLLIFFLSRAIALRFSSKNTYSFVGLYFSFLVTIFHSITAIFLAVAVIAACLPFLKAIFLKNFPRSESFKLPTALAAFRSAILSRLLPFGILFDKTLPPLILLFGASLSLKQTSLPKRTSVNLLGLSHS